MWDVIKMLQFYFPLAFSLFIIPCLQRVPPNVCSGTLGKYYSRWSLKVWGREIFLYTIFRPHWLRTTVGSSHPALEYKLIHFSATVTKGNTAFSLYLPPDPTVPPVVRTGEFLSGAFLVPVLSFQCGNATSQFHKALFTPLIPQPGALQGSSHWPWPLKDRQ